ncbi:PP2C family protein-serine/threonine phosphatase [Nocardioides dilutus]
MATELRYAGRTDVGLVREVNEDAYAAAPPVFVVADGMGGHAGGDVASAIAVEELARLAGSAFDRTAAEDAVLDALDRSQRRIQEHAAGKVGRAAPGTTVVAAVLVESDRPAWLVVNLGDSRAYRMASGRLEQVTRDHSLVQELLDAGDITEEQVADHPERHVITRALGGPGPAEPDLFWLDVADADRLLLCSDGVNGFVDDAHIAQVLATEPDPGEAATALVDAAAAAGGEDNATAIVVDVVG